MLKCVLTIAGSDSGAGAGIQADLKAMAAQGVYGLTALTAVTAQNTMAVEKFQLLPIEMVKAQIDAVLQDFEVAAVKTGMLGSAEIVAAVAEKIKQYRLQNVVIDPVMVAKSGDYLLEKDAQKAMQEQLFPLASLITPNLPEAEAFYGAAIKDLDDMKEAARHLFARGPSFVLLKGGHLRQGRELVDLLYDGEAFSFYRAPRIETKNTHGTGCTFASAIAANLARGRAVPSAVWAARRYLQEIVAYDLGLGHGSGPMDHFLPWRKDRGKGAQRFV
jgi:hydroxymethylpyrimidine/phosphomethylpyrimidine kinase